VKKAIVVGSGGQDGRLLWESLSRKNYQILGLRKNTIESNFGSDFRTVDIFKKEEVFALIKEFKPDEVYYLAAFHHNSEQKSDGMLEIYQKSQETHVLGLIHFLEAIVQLRPACRMFYAASSMIFGEPPSDIQTEQTPFQPNSVYGITKLSGLLTCKYFRATHGVFASVGILYNHESKYRGAAFLSQKTVLGALDVKHGRQPLLKVGDLSATVDWGSAADAVEAMQLILQAEKGEEFIVATGQGHTVQDFVKTTFDLLGMDWIKYVEEDPSILKRRKAILIGNAEKLKQVTGWSPKTSFSEMIREMIQAAELKYI
jgi:GDPmannose 4,6-dehydratase